LILLIKVNPIHLIINCTGNAVAKISGEGISRQSMVAQAQQIRKQLRQSASNMPLANKPASTTSQQTAILPLEQPSSNTVAELGTPPLTASNPLEDDESLNIGMNCTFKIDILKINLDTAFFLAEQ
jgi:hypothetical protein